MVVDAQPLDCRTCRLKGVVVDVVGIVAAVVVTVVFAVVAVVVETAAIVATVVAAAVAVVAVAAVAAVVGCSSLIHSKLVVVVEPVDSYYFRTFDVVVVAAVVSIAIANLPWVLLLHLLLQPWVVLVPLHTMGHLCLS